MWFRRLEIDRRSPRAFVVRGVRRLRDVGLHRWRDRMYVSEAAPVIVGGCGRSGTTLLRAMLDRHPRLFCGAESRLFLGQWPNVEWLSASFGVPEAVIREMLRSVGSQAEFIDVFFRCCCVVRGKPRWAEKTPRNVRHLDEIFAHFPRARFVHVIRDGRDTVCSLRTHTRDVLVGGRLVQRPARNPLDLCIARWRADVEAGLRHRGDARYLEVRYEDLVLRPRPTVARLTAFLGEDCDPDVLLETPADRRARSASVEEGAIFTASVGRWRRDLTASDLRVFTTMAGDLLGHLGYDDDAAPATSHRDAEDGAACAGAP